MLFRSQRHVLVGGGVDVDVADALVVADDGDARGLAHEPDQPLAAARDDQIDVLVAPHQQPRRFRVAPLRKTVVVPLGLDLDRLFDAVTDPIIASISDRWNGVRGRRIPFMSKGAIPAAVFCLLMFVPIVAGESHLNIFWLALAGCVQPAIAPGIDAAAARVLDRLGISLLQSPATGCCGAVEQHLGAVADRVDVVAYGQRTGREFLTNVDAPVPSPPGAGVEVETVNVTDLETYGFRIEAAKVIAGSHAITYGADLVRDRSANTDSSTKIGRAHV